MTGFYGILILMLLLIIFSSLLGFLLRYLPYILIIFIIMYGVRKLMEWVNRNDNLENKGHNSSTNYTSSSSTQAPDIIDVEFREREMDD